MKSSQINLGFYSLACVENIEGNRMFFFFYFGQYARGPKTRRGNGRGQQDQKPGASSTVEYGSQRLGSPGEEVTAQGFVLGNIFKLGRIVDSNANLAQ